jgi:alkanesulfonate monooxygenase SsuD/methylene tetrahydromethanopterin reductase-like flavin-dependent oxidoreductase (luciferase family)
MDIGILVAITARTGDIAEIARTAEAAGYESLWIPEHPVIPIGFKTAVPGGGKLPEHYGRWVDPFVALTIAATATKRIRLGTGICLLPEREPLITAKTVATLDLYSGGRVVLGVGAGWLREETEAMGANFGNRWSRATMATSCDSRPSVASPSRYRNLIRPFYLERMAPRLLSASLAAMTAGCPLC